MIFVPAPTLAFAERYLPLSEFCARLAKAEGTDIVCRADITDRKLTLFTKERPTSEIRSAVETFANLKFERTKSGWSLIPDPVWEKAEREYEAHLKAEKRAGVMRKIAEWGEMAIHSEPELRRIATEKQRAYETAKPADRQAAYREYIKYQPIHNIPSHDVFAGVVWRTASANARERIASGGTVVAATPGVLKSPDATIDRRYLRPVKDYEEDPPVVKPDLSDHVFVMGTSPESGELEGVHLWWRFGGANSGRWFPHRSPSDEEYAARDRLKLSELRNAWAVKEDGTASVPIAEGGEIQKVVDEFRVGIPEHLQWLHERSGVSICAESFRRAELDRRPLTGKTIGEWTASAGRRDVHFYNMSGFSGFIRLSRGWAGVLSPELPDRRRREPPERLIRAFQKNLTLNGAISYASGLSETARRPDWGCLLPFPFGGNHFASLSTLRLLGKLPPGEGPWRVSDLNPIARKAVTEWVRERMWDQRLPKELVIASLPGGPGMPSDSLVQIDRTGKAILHDQKDPRMGPNGISFGPWDPMSEFAMITVHVGPTKEMSVPGSTTLFRIGPYKDPSRR